MLTRVILGYFCRNNCFRAVLQVTARKQDAVLAGQADQPDIRSQAHHLPFKPTARMGLAHFYHVAQTDFSEHDFIIINSACWIEKR